MRRVLVSRPLLFNCCNTSRWQEHVETETFSSAAISYGAPYVCDQLSDKGICSAGAFAHPAFLKEHHFENLKSECLVSQAIHESNERAF